MSIKLIVAVAKNNVIGHNGELPWSLSPDLKYFKKMTKGSVVIMGRKTYESIGKPLKNRINIVVTSNPKLFEEKENLLLSKNLRQAIDIANKASEKEIWLIGGYSVYKDGLDNNLVDELFITQIDQEFEGDIYFPHFEKSDWEIVYSSKWATFNGIRYRFTEWKKIMKN